jgi:uncharacterized membrane protein
MATIKALIAGESWMTAATHFKGWDFFSSATFHTGVEHLRRALERQDVDVTYMPSHEAATAFPLRLEELQAYHVVVLSDIGANTLLLHPETWLHGKTMPNRLTLLAEYVRRGGGLAMAGGYFSFQGIYGAARYHGTAVEDVLPVQILEYDDRVEVPEGFTPRITESDHPILRDIPPRWPALLGYNVVRPKADAKVLATHDDRPILAVRDVGAGRTLAWMSDIGPHWCPESFVEWPGFEALWGQAVRWLARRL